MCNYNCNQGRSCPARVKQGEPCERAGLPQEVVNQAHEDGLLRSAAVWLIAICLTSLFFYSLASASSEVIEGLAELTARVLLRGNA